jgi:hypothetical protein
VTERTCVAICHRNDRAAIAVLSGDRLCDLRRFHGQQGDAARIVALARVAAAAYQADVIVTEPGAFQSEDSPHQPSEELNLRDAKARLCGSPTSTHHDLYQAVIRTRPELHHLARRAKDCRRSGVVLLAVALGLAYSTH